jgi:hypothetical protein
MNKNHLDSHIYHVLYFGVLNRYIFGEVRAYVRTYVRTYAYIHTESAHWSNKKIDIYIDRYIDRYIDIDIIYKYTLLHIQKVET